LKIRAQKPAFGGYHRGAPFGGCFSSQCLFSEMALKSTLTVLEVAKGSLPSKEWGT
jgi:hypothetical protein